MSYMTGHNFKCKSCDYFGKMIGTHNIEGEFVLECPVCQESWVEMTAEEQNEEAENRMDEAINNFNKLVSKK
ncbi:hypothetical protein [Marinobacterium zhoushanense]|nr:hypothetical protein [Marinobacterium zhoushanense]